MQSANMSAKKSEPALCIGSLAKRVRVRKVSECSQYITALTESTSVRQIPHNASTNCVEGRRRKMASHKKTPDGQRELHSCGQWRLLESNGIYARRLQSDWHVTGALMMG